MLAGFNSSPAGDAAGPRRRAATALLVHSMRSPLPLKPACALHAGPLCFGRLLHRSQPGLAAGTSCAPPAPPQSRGTPFQQPPAPHPALSLVALPAEGAALGQAGPAAGGRAQDRGAAAAEDHRLGVREHRGAADGGGGGEAQREA